MKYFLPFLVFLLSACGAPEHPSGSLATKGQLLPKKYVPTPGKKIAHVFPDRIKFEIPPPCPGPEPEPEVFVYVETPPEFPGGQTELNKYLKQNTMYPQMALEMGIQGKVYVEFTVVQDGSISDVKVLRSIDQSLDREAIRVLRAMPKWRPAESQGRHVKRTMVLPIIFRID